jgi:hypothetical protein
VLHKSVIKKTWPVTVASQFSRPSLVHDIADTKNPSDSGTDGKVRVGTFHLNSLLRQITAGSYKVFAYPITETTLSID